MLHPQSSFGCSGNGYKRQLMFALIQVLCRVVAYKLHQCIMHHITDKFSQHLLFATVAHLSIISHHLSLKTNELDAENCCFQ